MVSIRQITLRGEPPYEWRTAWGICLGLGCQVTETPAGLFVSEADADRIAAKLAADRAGRVLAS